jgi:HlyD family secretion protein
MDIAISKTKSPKSKRNIILIVLAVTLFFSVRYLWILSQSDFSIERKTIVYGEVKRDKFTVSVRGSGILVPDDIQWLSAGAEAKVERLIVKAGHIVKRGELLVKLSNPSLSQELSEAEWEYEALQAEFEAAKVTQESDLQRQKSLVLHAKLDLKSSELEYEANSELIGIGAVSKLKYAKSRLAVDQFRQRWVSSKEEFVKLGESLAAQNNARTARLNKTQKGVDRIKQLVDDLNVKATMDSVVLEVPLEVGQSVTVGTNIAKLAKQDSLIAELRVPEIQIREVAIGQKVVVDTRNNLIEGVVSRIDPAVSNGNVLVDVRFTETLPNDARPDLSVDGEIKITEIEDTLFVERPIFAQSKSNSMFYKISADGQFAERVNVKVGFGSASYIQVLTGLQVGDQIVTSDPTRFETYTKIRIN